MKTQNGDLPAMPIYLTDAMMASSENGAHDAVNRVSGLTKREEFAAKFMAAWIIHHGAANNYGYNKESAANDAIESADTLLAALERTK